MHTAGVETIIFVSQLEVQDERLDGLPQLVQHHRAEADCKVILLLCFTISSFFD